MQRRGLLTAIAVALAGCTGAGGGSGSDGDDDPVTDTPTSSPTPTPTATPTPTPAATPSAVTGTDLAAMRNCSVDDPVIDVAPGTVKIEGCVRGRNGCAEPRLGAVEYDPASGRLDVVVRSVVDVPPDTVCTQALTDRGYRATISLDAGRPATVAVVHDDVDGRRQVAILER